MFSLSPSVRLSLASQAFDGAFSLAFFFLEYAGDLRIIALRRRKSFQYN
jgi:hypothetical protein